LNAFQYPSTATIPDPAGIITPISTCVFFSEYSQVTGIMTGSTYRFNITNNGYITLRSGSATGPVVAQAYSYLIYTATSTADLFAHYTRNAACDQASNCETNSVQLLLDCVPPQAWYSFSGDCDTGEFYIDLDISSLGDAPSLTVEFDVLGAVGVVNNVPVGLLQLGPFYEGEVINISILHPSDPSCTITFNNLVPAVGCPFLLTCGAPPLILNYCHGNNEEQAWFFQGVGGTGAINISFLGGTLQPSWQDQFTIYDGPDASSPILYQHNSTQTVDLAGLVLFSSAPQLFITLVTNASGSCADGVNTALSWQIACLDCALPQAIVTAVDDCDNDEFSVVIDITTVGDGATAGIQYTINGGAPQVLDGLDVGQIELGPYPVNTVVNITLLHETNGLCNIPMGNFTDSGTCPTLVNCGSEWNETLCYGNNMDVVYYYQGIGDYPLALFFNGGTVEPCCDFLYVYNGTDVNAPLLYQGNNFGNLAGLFFTASNPENRLTVRFTSDISVSCQSDPNYVPLNWTLSCLDCTPPAATFQVVQDCDNFQYFVDVMITELGSDENLEITNTAGLASTFATAAGTYQIGPITSGNPVQITLVNDANSLCNLASATLVNPLCPTYVCGTNPLQETYCYGSLENMAWAYAVSDGAQVRIRFNRGTMESSNWDRLRIYDGPDNQSPLVFNHTQFQTVDFGPPGSAILGPGQFYYNIDITSSGSNLYMELTSDFSVHCTNGFGYDPMDWELTCVGCQAPGVNYELVADCEHLIYKAEVQVTEVLGAQGLQITENVSGQALTATAPGTFIFETYDLDAPINFTVVDLDNNNCTYESGPMVYTRDSCVINSCGIDNYEICYENDEDRWYTFRSEGGMPISIYFYSGNLLPGDYIVLYNSLTGGVGQSVIYQGNNSGNLTGITANSSNPNNAITLRIRSNASGSCVDGQANGTLRWDVGCGFVGVEEVEAGNFMLFPNPTDGILNIDMTNVQGPVVVRVMDMSGRLVHEQRSNAAATTRTTLDLGMLQNGQYVVHLVTDRWVGTRSFQLMR
jgi:hypothetical protein